MVQLYDSQLEVLSECEGKPHAGLYLGCGAGKTFVGSEKLVSYDTPWNLLICQKSKVKDWVRHFEAHYPQLTVTDLTKIGAMTLGNLRPGIMIINYDLVFRRPILLTLRNFTLMLDESSLIQNSKAKRTKFILKMKPDHVVLLSGTPVSGGQLDKDEGLIYGKYENLLSQVNLLGWKISKRAYWDRYINWAVRQYGEVRVNEVVGYKRIPELNAKLKDLGCVFRRTDDMVDLPEYDDQIIYVSRIPEYNKMVRNGIVEVDGDKLIGDLPITKMLRLRQICGHYTKEKLSALADILDSLENERVVIFYNFNSELARIKGLIDDSRPVFLMTGEVKTWDEEVWKRPEFNNAVVLCQYQAGSYAHNMQAARYLINFSVTNSAELYEQSRGRIRRNGQVAERVMYYHIVVKDSIEEKELANVKAGLDYTLEDYERDYERNED